MLIHLNTFKVNEFVMHFLDLKDNKCFQISLSKNTCIIKTTKFSSSFIVVWTSASSKILVQSFSAGLYRYLSQLLKVKNVVHLMQVWVAKNCDIPL